MNPYAGHDPSEDRYSVAVSKMMSLRTIDRYKRWRAASQIAPPTAAVGGFPYYRGKP